MPSFEEEKEDEDEDEVLKRAIAMSLEEDEEEQEVADKLSSTKQQGAGEPLQRKVCQNTA